MAEVVVGRRACLAWSLCGAMFIVACGRTSVLPGILDRPDEVSGAANVSSAGSSGVPNAGASFGGAFISAGGNDTAGQSACPPSNADCQGQLEQHLEWFAQDVRVLTLSAAPDGRVAIGGTFQGSLDMGGQVLTSDPDGAGFVGVFDANARLLWARSVEGSGAGSGAEQVTGVAFATDGALVLQGRSYATLAPNPQFVLGFDQRGQRLWRQDFGNLDNVPSKVVVDLNGDAWLGGTLSDQLTFGSRSLSHAGFSAYLLRVNAAGDLIDAMKLLGDECVTSVLSDFATDDTGQLIVGLSCRDGSGSEHDFLQKRRSDGTLIFEKRVTSTWAPGSLRNLSVTVDHAGRITTGASFVQRIENPEREAVIAAPPVPNGALWLAQYSRAGDRLWQRVYSDQITYPSLSALASDPLDNVIVAATCLVLTSAQGEIIPPSKRVSVPSTCVLKLGADAR
jgi:hypothetical protein